MPRRLAIFTVCALTFFPAGFRALASRPLPPRACAPDGRGSAPRHWVGCVTDAGPRRDLSGRERQLLGLAIDVNTASPEDLASVPGLSARLAVALVAERARNGPFQNVDGLIRVPGIGPARLARARPFLAIGR